MYQKKYGIWWCSNNCIDAFCKNINIRCLAHDINPLRAITTAEDKFCKYLFLDFRGKGSLIFHVNHLLADDSHRYQASFFIIPKSIKNWKSHLLQILDGILWVDLQIPVPILWETVINLTLSLPVQSADNLAPPKITPVTNPESQLFDNLIVFLIFFLKMLILKKKSAAVK